MALFIVLWAISSVNIGEVRRAQGLAALGLLRARSCRGHGRAEERIGPVRAGRQPGDAARGQSVRRSDDACRRDADARAADLLDRVGQQPDPERGRPAGRGQPRARQAAGRPLCEAARPREPPADDDRRARARDPRALRRRALRLRPGDAQPAGLGARPSSRASSRAPGSSTPSASRATPTTCPVSSGQFRSNWELSSARANAVLQFMLASRRRARSASRPSATATRTRWRPTRRPPGAARTGASTSSSSAAPSADPKRADHAEEQESPDRDTAPAAAARLLRLRRTS